MPIAETAGKIKALEIQGATKVAVEAVKALAAELRELEWVEREEAVACLEDSIQVLVGSRPTEPLMRNGLRFVESRVLEARWSSPGELAEVVGAAEADFLGMLERAREDMVEVGARRIEDGDTVMTHCHSSAVTGTLLRAHERGVRFRVLQTETRPKYQGRITARELVEAGVDTTMIVDSAARYYMKEVDFVLVGCDAITSEGNVVNKIGTSQVALAAWEARIPFYVVTTLLKFDPATIRGGYEVIEERETAEIWENPPKGLKILNPAFDITRRDYIHGLITEEGIISPHSILEAIHRHYPWMLGGRPSLQG